MIFFKPKDTLITSPLDGISIPLAEVKDEVFSQAMMGPGAAVIPSGDTIVAPFDGQIRFVFPTKHAIGMISASGIELLIHIGIDTVNLEGKPFDILVKEKQKVKRGHVLAKVDLNMLMMLKVDPTVIMVITNPSQWSIESISFGSILALQSFIQVNPSK